MLFTPPRARGLLLGGLILVLLLGATALGVLELASAAVSPLTTLWVSLPIVATPLSAAVVYRLYGLLTASYRIDRNGFRLRWGLAGEEMPLAAVDSLRAASQVPGEVRVPRGWGWPGSVIGRGTVEGLGVVEFFATVRDERLLLLSGAGKTLAISPADPKAFVAAYVEANRLGSLQPIGTRSLRPNFFLARLWSDRLGTGLILAGLGLPLLQLGFLALRVPGLPAQVPFGFNPLGVPGPWVPPGRLLLLPLVAGLCWLADVAVGAWLYRREAERPLAYGVWATAVAVGVLLWGAGLSLLAAAK